MTGTFGVGLIGVNPDGGWARESHVPAIHAVDGLELTAVATRHQASADRVAVAFEAPRATATPWR
jgi:predicted dehydrogenase